MLKLIKEEQLRNENNLKINLFTFKDGKKIDSIEFYRNISNIGRGLYNCLSYFDKKTNKIWQIKYFYFNEGNSVDIISYKEISISSDGTIQSDLLHYLDESLDVEMEKLNLYY